MLGTLTDRLSPDQLKARIDRARHGVHVARVDGTDRLVRLGAEKWFQERYGLRLGANDGDLTAGASLRMKEWEFDYAFAAGEIGDIQRISFLKRF